MPGIELKDGRVLRSEVELPPEVWDAVAAGVEKGGTPPKGFTVSGEVRQAELPEQPGLTQRFGNALGVGLGAARDVTTGAVSKLGQIGASMSPEGMSLEDPLQQPGPERQASSDFVAKQVVPQTPSDLLTTLALGATSKIPGMGGVIARLAATAGGDVTGKYLAGEEQNLLDTALKTGVTGAAEVGGMIAPQFSKQLREVAKEQQGRADIKQLGDVLSQHTSFKTLDTPEALAGALSGSRFQSTPISDMVSGAIDASEKQLLGGIKQTQAQVPLQQSQIAINLLEKAADVSPQKTPGFISASVQYQPDQLFEMAINRARHIREQMTHAAESGGKEATAGMTAHDYQQQYNEVIGWISNALRVLDPSLEMAYKQMNQQYRKDLYTARFLYNGRDQFISTGLHGAKVLTPELGDYVMKNVGDIQDPNITAGIIDIVTRGGAFGAGDQKWTVGPRIGSPQLPFGGGRAAETFTISGQTPARPRRTGENMPPMGVYDIGALKGLELAQPEEKRK